MPAMGARGSAAAAATIDALLTSSPRSFLHNTGELRHAGTAGEALVRRLDLHPRPHADAFLDRRGQPLRQPAHVTGRLIPHAHPQFFDLTAGTDDLEQPVGGLRHALHGRPYVA